MKTNLDKTINSIEDAKNHLLELIENNEHYHPDDPARDIGWGENITPPTPEECEKLDKLMHRVFEFDFDPYGFIIDNSSDPDWVKTIEKLNIKCHIHADDEKDLSCPLCYPKKITEIDT